MKNYVMNMETLKIELYFEKSEFDALDDSLKKELKSTFLWSRAKGAWVSRAKEPNLWKAKRVAEKLGFTEEERHGERLSYAEQLERKAERAEARADRMEGYAANAEKRAESLQKEFNEYSRDWSWLTQPIIAGHSGSQRFAKQRQAVMDRYDKGFEEYRKSDYFKDRAETARRTASMKELKDPVYLERRIKECKAEIKKCEGFVVNYENMLYKMEQGEEVKRWNGDVISMKEVSEYLRNVMERMEAAMDKQAFMENCLEEIGGIKFSRENIKVGYIVNTARWGRCEIVKANPTTVLIKTERGSHLQESYGAILEILVAEEKKNDEQHPYKVGEILAHYSICGKRMICAYKVVKITAKTVKLAPLAIQDGIIDPDKVIGKEITRKPSVKIWNGEWAVYDGDWQLHRVSEDQLAKAN